MIFSSKPKIEIVKEIDATAYHWCNEALLIYVKNGLAALTKRSSEYDRDYSCKGQLLLNGTPLIQGDYPGCPTCTAMLARGYGIEKANCQELLEVRDRINQDYVNIRTSAETLKSLLGLLEEGYYLLADVYHTPTDGESCYFANVPDALEYFSPACDSYYNHAFLTATYGFPKYLYPTQSNASLNQKHAESYLERMKQPNAPRAIAYYHLGFTSALLDGHHKAYAAALLGVQLPCLTIIPMTTTWYRGSDNAEFCSFSDIHLLKSELPKFKGFPKRQPQEITIVPLTVPNQPISEEDLHLENYIPIDVLTGFFAAGLDESDITEEQIKDWIRSPYSRDKDKIKQALLYLAKIDPERACTFAKIVIAVKDDTLFPTKTAFEVLLKHKSPETEQLFLDYLISHDKTSRYWEIVTSYWEDEA